MSYSSDQTTQPFWADFPLEASGRDPLAIQNSSVVIYSNMIVGITNVTNRIRYMSFYCWLFDAIAHKTQKANSLKEQQLYLRRAELLLAYLYASIEDFKGVTGISGTNYALRNIDKIIRLDLGADIENKKAGVYWKFGMGVFGQYYAGAVRDLDLIFHPQGDVNIYTLTDKGQELANTYANNISPIAINLFLKSIFDGKISESKLTELSDFALHIIPQKTQEQKLFRKILFSEDYKSDFPTYHRSDSLKLLLELLKLNPDGVENLTLGFLKYNYQQHAQVEILENNTATSWYMYEINELLHVAYEHFHAAFQYNLDTYPTPMHEVLELLQMDSDSTFIEENVNPEILTMNEFLEGIDSENVYEYFDKMIENDSWGICLNNAIKTIFAVYKQCKSQKEQLYKLASLPSNNYDRPGYAIEMFVELVESKLDLTLSEYCRKILLQAINQHMFSSYQKSKIGQALVHNYMIEDNMAWRLRETSPGRTTPRLDNAIQYLADTGLVSKEGKLVKITIDGLKVIESI